MLNNILIDREAVLVTYSPVLTQPPYKINLLACLPIYITIISDQYAELLKKCKRSKQNFGNIFDSGEIWQLKGKDHMITMLTFKAHIDIEEY